MMMLEVIRHVVCTIREGKVHSSSLLMTAAFLEVLFSVQYRTHRLPIAGCHTAVKIKKSEIRMW
jgi:hypothetical protein